MIKTQNNPNFIPTSHNVKAKAMTAFNNDSKRKEKYIARALNHQHASDYLQNYGYYINGKGSALGCLTEDNHNPAVVLQNDAGFPEALGYLMDQIFEKLPDGKFQGWAHRVITATKPGADLSLITSYFVIWLLSEELPKRFDPKKFPDLHKLCTRILKLYWRELEGTEVSPEEWKAAVNTASRLVTTTSHTAASVDTADTMAASRVAYTLNYAVRGFATPRANGYMVTSAGGCGVSYDRMSNRLINIIGGIDPQKARHMFTPLGGGVSAN